MVGQPQGFIKMKKYHLIFLLVLLSNSILLASENKFYSNPSACPVEELVIPHRIIAPNNLNVLTEIISGKDGRQWEAQKDEGAIRLLFRKDTIVRRFQMKLVGSNSDSLVPIETTWIPQDSSWGDKTGYFYVKPDGQTYCFFLGYHANIPENIAVREMVFNIPSGLVLQKLAFSEKPSEAVMESCPMPDLQYKINNAYNECIKNPNDMDKEKEFVELFEKALHTYDCMRTYDYEPVPAWWLCDHEDTYNWLRLLSQMSSLEAKKLFGSSLFRSTLDGSIAELYYEESQKIGEQFK
jgi:hypothetical protein